MNSDHLARQFNLAFQKQWNTKLVGGFAEPLYLPSHGQDPAEIRFTGHSVRSALHELAHWCVAGVERRTQVDYGYWYCPDGRSEAEQVEFFKVEIKPQSIEKAFANRCKVEFEVSCDNLNGQPGDSKKFEEWVNRQWAQYELSGYPLRAQKILIFLRELNDLDDLRLSI